MNVPIANLYGRVTRKGIEKRTSRNNRKMVRFTLSALVERQAPTMANGDEITDASLKARKPWWLRCVVLNPHYLAQAEALGPGDYVSITGQVTRRRWFGDDKEWHDEWSVMVDSMASFMPGQRYPMKWADEATEQAESTATPPALQDDEVAPPEGIDDADPTPEVTAPESAKASA